MGTEGSRGSGTLGTEASRLLYCAHMPQDRDLKKLTPAALRNEVMRLRKALRKHRDADENARCWHNDLALYGLLPEGKKPGKLRGPEKVLLRNCLKYIRRQKCDEC